ncbi:hypothetical protein COOONC_06433, partial [Cooperia oncophora]
MQNSNPMGNPNMPPGGYPPPNQGQLHQQQPGMGYYGQPGPGQPQQPPMGMQSQQMMMGGGSSGMSMGYQSGVPQMMQQQPVQPNPPASMMQQAIFGAQASASRQPFSGSSANQPTGFSSSSSVSSMAMGGVPTQGPPSYPTQP